MSRTDVVLLGVVQEVPLSQLVSSRLAAVDGAGGPSLLEACCDLCHAHGSQLRREALAMVQSLEVWCPATGIPIQAAATGQQVTAPPTGGSGAPCARAPDHRLVCNQSSLVCYSRVR